MEERGREGHGGRWRGIERRNRDRSDVEGKGGKKLVDGRKGGRRRELEI